MESVIETIRRHREKEIHKQAVSNITDTIIDGCRVKLRFDSIGDQKAMSAAQSMLISSYINVTGSIRGEYA